MAFRIEKGMPLFAPVMSIVLGNMLGLDGTGLLGLEGVKCLEDDV